jgi:holo-[acyl-carrier protein] synthase
MLNKIGVGIDIIEIKRFKKIPYKTNSGFYKKIFLASEINYCTKFKNPYEHFAGKFAIKEAAKKSISAKINFLDIETYHSNSSPKIRVMGKYKTDYIFLVSVSHEQSLAVAVVISKKI